MPCTPQAIANRTGRTPLSSPGIYCRHTRQGRWTCDPACLALQGATCQGKDQQTEKCQCMPGLLCGYAFCGILCVGHFANLGMVFSRNYSVPQVPVWPIFIVGKNNAGSATPAPAYQHISCGLYTISYPQPETLTSCRPRRNRDLSRGAAGSYKGQSHRVAGDCRRVRKQPGF